jgi:hypothetical protein
LGPRLGVLEAEALDVDAAEAVDLESDRRANLAELLLASRRDAVPIRERFLQIRGDPPEPGPLSELVRGGYDHALDVYLLILAATSSPPHRLYINPDFWALLTRKRSQSLRNARRVLYRSLDALSDLELIRQETHLGVPLYRILDESGSGNAYFHPATRGDRYLTLPHAYWERGFDRRLELPGKVVLLLARSLKPESFTLPLANAMQWYGVSPDTLRRGMDELVKAKLVRYTKEDVASAKAPRGTVVRRTYTLLGPVAHKKPAQRRPIRPVKPS